MGKITNALKKAAEDRMTRIDKISKIKERSKLIVNRIGESNVDPSLVTFFDSKALISEQYKTLRTNILSMNKGKPPKSIVITSSTQSEGKTVTSLNLAFSMAQEVHKPKVLLVDADLRKGKMVKYLGVERNIGFSELLSEQASMNDVMFHLDAENLTFISSGAVPENPSELLASKNMKNFLSTVRAEFDFVIIDTPPIIAVTDAGIVGNQVDGVIMVVQAGKTQRGVIHRAEEILYQSHSKVLGQVLTNIEYHLPEYIYRYL